MNIYCGTHPIVIQKASIINLQLFRIYFDFIHALHKKAPLRGFFVGHMLTLHLNPSNHKHYIK